MNSKEILLKEKALGKQAAKITQNYLQAVMQQRMSVQGNGKAKDNPLKATRVTAKMGDYRLLGLNFKTNRVAMIQNYGFVGVRQGGEVYFKNARYNVKRSSRKAANVNLPALDLFDDFYRKSGAAAYLLNGLKETRSQALINSLRNRILTLNEE